MLKIRKSAFIRIAALSLAAFSVTAGLAVAEDPIAPAAIESYSPAPMRDAAKEFGYHALGAAKKGSKNKPNKNRPNKNRPSNNSTSLFVGTWQVVWNKVYDDCAGSNSPDSFNSTVSIDKKLAGKDLADGSPLFTGAVKGNSILFAREGYYKGCLYTQALQLANVSNGSADGGLRSTIDCGANFCTIDYAGSAQRK